MDYTYGPHLRWAFNWKTPNEAGVFLACWFPLIWGWIAFHPNRYSKAVGWVLELLLAGALCLTYSRGALISVVLGGLIFILYLHGVSRNDNQKLLLQPLLGLGVRLLILVLLLLGTDFYGRIEPDFLLQDRSVLNRVELWKGGLSLLAASPWVGWGWGESGRAYMNWIAPLDQNLGYRTMVNGYLTLGVECGVPLLALLFWAVLSLLGLCWPMASRALEPQAFFCRRAAAIPVSLILLFLVAQGTSHFLSSYGLWILPGLAGVGLIGLVWRESSAHFLGRLRVSLIRGGIIVLILFALLWPVVTHFSGYPILLHPITHGVVELRRVDETIPAGTPNTITIVADHAVLGEYYGKEIRRLFATVPNIKSLLVIDSSTFYKGKCFWLLLTGESCNQSQRKRSGYTHLGLIHPIGKPPTSSGPKPDWVLLPAWDDRGNKQAWIDYCTQAQIRVIETPGSGTDIRKHWPEILTSKLLEVGSG